MTYINEMIDGNPDKHDSLIKDRILNNEIKMKLDEYKSVQVEYINLLSKNASNQKAITSWNDLQNENYQTGSPIAGSDNCKTMGVDSNMNCPQWKQCCPGGSGSDGNITCGASDCPTNGQPCLGTWMKENCQLTCGICKDKLEPKTTNPDWEYLGEFDNLEDCKKESTENRQGKYASIVYYTNEFGNNWAKTCYGGVKGGKMNPLVQQNVITSIPSITYSPPTSGNDVKLLLNNMKKIQNELNNLLQQQKTRQAELKQTTSIFKSQDNSPDVNLVELDEKIQENKKEIDKISTDLAEYAYTENDSISQKSIHMIYILWVILAILTLWVSLQLYLSPSDNIYMYIYIFVGLWILFGLIYYYKAMVEYGKNVGTVFSNIISIIPLPA